jgi:hypothetical protein
MTMTKTPPSLPGLLGAVLSLLALSALLAVVPPPLLADTPAGSPGGKPAGSNFFVPPTQACPLDSATAAIPAEARALILLDSRLHELIAPALHDYARAAARRRRFVITTLPIPGLDDQSPAQVRSALQSWHSARPGLEGILFVGNIKLPSFFLPRADIHSVRLWPRYFEDLDMTPRQRVAPGTVLKGEDTTPGSWPKIAGVKELVVPTHDFDDFAEGPTPGPEIWTAFLPVGFQEATNNHYRAWATQLEGFFKKATAFHQGSVQYGCGLYLVSNDLGLMARSQPAWTAIGPGQIEFYALNEKGPGAYKNNPAGYQRARLEKYESLEAFLAYGKTLPGMDEGWQSPDIFLAHMNQSRRRIVWWNVHSNPEVSMISWKQARDLYEGGLIALLNGCSVGGFSQPGSATPVDTKVTPERNLLVNLVYGRSAFVAALGSVHDRVTEERATPFLRHLYSGGYLGRAQFLRLRQQDEDVHANPALVREFQELLVGDPFADTQ